MKALLLAVVAYTSLAQAEVANVDKLADALANFATQNEKAKADLLQGYATDANSEYDKNSQKLLLNEKKWTETYVKGLQEYQTTFNNSLKTIETELADVQKKYEDDSSAIAKEFQGLGDDVKKGNDVTAKTKDLLDKRSLLNSELEKSLKAIAEKRKQVQASFLQDLSNYNKTKLEERRKMDGDYIKFLRQELTSREARIKKYEQNFKNQQNLFANQVNSTLVEGVKAQPLAIDVTKDSWERIMGGRKITMKVFRNKESLEQNNKYKELFSSLLKNSEISKDIDLFKFNESGELLLEGKPIEVEFYYFDNLTEKRCSAEEEFYLNRKLLYAITTQMKFEIKVDPIDRKASSRIPVAKFIAEDENGKVDYKADEYDFVLAQLKNIADGKKFTEKTMEIDFGNGRVRYKGKTYRPRWVLADDSDKLLSSIDAEADERMNERWKQKLKEIYKPSRVIPIEIESKIREQYRSEP
jgi:hypothetical protein